MAFKPIQKLLVHRTTSLGQKVNVGVLAQNRQGVFFQYDEGYFTTFGNLSPFSLTSDTTVQLAPQSPHYGLHGVFADALPDGWGLLLQDRVFRQHGILPNQLTPMDRLAFVGNTALGALSFSPISEFTPTTRDVMRLDTLGMHAQLVFDGQTEEVLSALVTAGSSGGARPKTQIYIHNSTFDECSTVEKTEHEAWIVKFTSKNLALGHEESLCEAVYLKLANDLNLKTPEWTLIKAPKQSGAKKWLAVKRFDHLKNVAPHGGRLHMHSACGLLDADFRSPSLDYEDLIKASRILCKSPAVGQLQFKRAIFNLVFLNQDDHSKNWAFLQNDSGQWQPAPFFDITFSPHPFGEQATSFAGFGKTPPLKALQQLAQSASFAQWQTAKTCVLEIIEKVSGFEPTAIEFGVSPTTASMIQKRLNESRQAVLNSLTG